MYHIYIYSNTFFKQPKFDRGVCWPGGRTTARQCLHVDGRACAEWLRQRAAAALRCSSSVRSAVCLCVSRVAPPVLGYVCECFVLCRCALVIHKCTVTTPYAMGRRNNPLVYPCRVEGWLNVYGLFTTVLAFTINV